LIYFELLTSNLMIFMRCYQRYIKRYSVCYESCERVIVWIWWSKGRRCQSVRWTSSHRLSCRTSWWSFQWTSRISSSRPMLMNYCTSV
jgi:hypothetical protein